MVAFPAFQPPVVVVGLVAFNLNGILCISRHEWEILSIAISVETSLHHIEWELMLELTANKTLVRVGTLYRGKALDSAASYYLNRALGKAMSGTPKGRPPGRRIVDITLN